MIAERVAQNRFGFLAVLLFVSDGEYSSPADVFLPVMDCEYASKTTVYLILL